MPSKVGGQRQFRAERCADCGVHTELCVCPLRPHLDLATRVVVVQHNRDRNKPTNTGRHVPAVLRNADITRYAVRGAEFDPAPLLDPAYDYALLFHRAEGDPVPGVPELGLDELRAASRPRAIVVLDGTWAQASRMSRRIPEVARLPTFTLPSGPPSIYTVRTRQDPERLCTFEAVTRIVAAIEGEAPARAMQRWFNELTARLLFMKGRLPKPVVPSEWSDAPFA